MPQLDFEQGVITHLTMAPEETGAVTRVHCEAKFTKKIASVLKVAGPDVWPSGWKGSKLKIDPMPIKSVNIVPFDSEMSKLGFEIEAQMMTDFATKEVTRDDDELKLITFSIKTSSPDASQAVGHWMNTGGKAPCDITVSYPTQKEIKEMERERELQLQLQQEGVEE